MPAPLRPTHSPNSSTGGNSTPPMSPTRSRASPAPTQTYSRLSGVGTENFGGDGEDDAKEVLQDGTEEGDGDRKDGGGVGRERSPEILGGAVTAKPGVFVPFSVPRHRRLQTLAIILWAALLPLCLGTFFLACSIPLMWPLVISYLVWVLMIDRAAMEGGRSSGWVRRWPLWVWFVGYFPVRLHKTADLPADRTYIFGYHPHGIIGMGAISNFATEATGFSELFPGLTPHLMTLATNFSLPLYRDILLSMGIVSVSMRSCRNILRKGPGSTITIVIGGAAESLSAHPGTADLTLKRRMGFIKLAIREGADLVPVFSFGENDIFAQLQNNKGSNLYKLQKQFQNIFGFTLPIFHGRGIFNYVIGVMPYRHPIESVVGRPIRTEKNENPTKEELEKVQKQYIDELMRIWDEYKDEFAPHRTRELQLIA